MKPTLFLLGPSDLETQNTVSKESVGQGRTRVDFSLAGVLPILPPTPGATPRRHSISGKGARTVHSLPAYQTGEECSGNLRRLCLRAHSKTRDTTFIGFMSQVSRRALSN